MFYQNNSELIAAMMEKGYLKSPRLGSAFKANQRDFFVPLAEKGRAFWDIALPLFENQTISQPSTVAIMLELLEVKPGQKVLEIGAGSGWVSCLLAHLVGSRGKVFALKLIQWWENLAKKRCSSQAIKIFLTRLAMRRKSGIFLLPMTESMPERLLKKCRQSF